VLTHVRGTWRAVWYRHWLEHAGAALVALGSVVVLCVVYAVTVLVRMNRYTSAGEIPDSYRLLDAAVDETQLVPLGTHVLIAAAAAWLLPLFLHGTGIRTNDLRPGHPSLSYTLTLPVARSRLVWTRFVVACVSAILLQALVLGVNAATLTLLDYPMPFGAMAAASTLATLLLLTVVAAIGLMNIWDDRAVGYAVPLLFIGLALAGWQRSTGLIGSATVPWTAVASLGLLLGASLAVTTLVARFRDF
jgi:hypothetical protein